MLHGSIYFTVVDNALNWSWDDAENESYPNGNCLSKITTQTSVRAIQVLNCLMLLHSRTDDQFRQSFKPIGYIRANGAQVLVRS